MSSLSFKARLHGYMADNYELSKPSRKGWYDFDCPLCGGIRKRGVHFQLGGTKCWTCDFRGSILEFIQQVTGWTYEQTKKHIDHYTPVMDMTLPEHGVVSTKVSVSEVILPTGWHSILDSNDYSSVGIMARRHLEKRGFNLEVLDEKGFGYCDEHTDERNTDFYGYIIVPFKTSGTLSYYLGRDCMGNFLRYKNPPVDYVGVGKADVIYNQRALYFYEDVGITEGWADAETWGPDCTATLGWDISDNQIELYLRSPAKAFTLFPDAGADNNGNLFYHKAIRVADKFLNAGKKIRVVNLNVPQALRVGKDINEIGKDIVQQLRDRTPYLTYRSMYEILSQKSKVTLLT